jgi:hypothetical protein
MRRDMPASQAFIHSSSTGPVRFRKPMKALGHVENDRGASEYTSNEMDQALRAHLARGFALC